MIEFPLHNYKRKIISNQYGPFEMLVCVVDESDREIFNRCLLSLLANCICPFARDIDFIIQIFRNLRLNLEQVKMIIRLIRLEIHLNLRFCKLI